MKSKQKSINILSHLNKQNTKKIPKLAIGDTVNLKVKIKEGNRVRLQAYEGTIIAQRKAGVSTTITVRKTFQGVGVERVFPVYSPQITEIQVLRHAFVRRSKLYYLRNRRGKAARLRMRLTG